MSAQMHTLRVDPSRPGGSSRKASDLLCQIRKRAASRPQSLGVGATRCNLWVRGWRSAAKRFEPAYPIRLPHRSYTCGDINSSRPLEPELQIRVDPKAGESTAETLEQYRTELRRFFKLKSRNAQHSNDLVQEVYLQALRFPPAEQLREPLAYLFKIAWHVVNRFNQRTRTDPVSYDSVVAEERAEFGGADLWSVDISEQAGLEEQFDRVLRELPPKMQAVLLLRKRDGLSYKEIARETSLSVHTVKKYIARAVVHFKNADWGP